MTNSPSELYTRYCRPRVGEILQALRLDVTYHRAEGDFLYYRDEQGREVPVADFLGGFGTMMFGHNHPELTAVAASHYADKRPLLAQMSCRASTALLGQKLHQMMWARTGRSYLTTLANTGTEAVEAAMKHAEFAHTERVQRLLRELDDKEAAVRRGVRERRYTPSRQLFEQARAWLRFTGPDDFERVAAAVRAHNAQVFQAPSVFVALERAFHGKTLGSVALTHHADYRRHYLRSSPRALFVENGDVQGLERTVSQAVLPYLALRVGQDNQVTLVEQSHVNLSALFIEPIQGEGGIRVVPRAFLSRCRELATQHGFPLVFDEIQCGMGRTGTFLYSEQQEVFADYYILSKGLGGGLTKISALLVEQSHYEREFGLLHTSTFAEDELSAAVALEALELLERRPELMRNCAERGWQLRDGLLSLREQFPGVIKDVRGAGLMLGVEFHPQVGRGSPAIEAIFTQELLSYVISGYLLHEHRVRIAPCMSNKALIRLEPSALITPEACEAMLQALRGVCEVLEAQNAFELLRFAVGRPRRGAARGPLRSFRAPERAEAPPRVDARVAFIGYFVDATDLRRWDASLSDFSDAELKDLVRRMYLTVDPFVVDEQVVRSVGGRSVSLTVVGIPIDSATFAETMQGPGRAALAAKVEEAVKVAVERGCSAAALGGFTSIVTGNGLSLRQDGIALTTGNSLTVAMGLQSIQRAAAHAGIELSQACFAAIGATGNIGSVYSQVMAEQVPRMILIGRPGRTRELETVAADIYLRAAQELAAHATTGGLPAPRGIAAQVAPTRAVRKALAEGLTASDGRRLYEALTAELGERAPITVTTDLEMLRYANLILGASNAPQPVIQPALLGKGPTVICDVAIPSDVADAVRALPNVHIVEGGLVRLPLEPELAVHGLNLPPGHLYACCCEGVLMGLSGIRENYSLGAITRQQVVDVMKLAGMHGFTLGEPGKSAMHAL